MADNYIFFFENGMFIELSDKIFKKLNLNMHDFIYYIHFDHADDVEVSKTHKNTRVKYDTLDINGLSR